jgi:hypothetical protein
MTAVSEPGRPGEPPVTSELVRLLGAIALSPPPASHVLCDAAGLPRIGGADHTAAFVLLAPPYAAIHLGAEGKLGGEGRDRVEGFWRALGQPVPDDADHLGVLLMCYAGLRELSPGIPAAARAAQTLFHEHIWPFAPGYLSAAEELGIGSVSAWARLALELLQAELAELPSPAGRAALPLALREAPAPLTLSASFDEVLDAAVTPARSGMILTQRELAAGAAELGIGYRRGERRYALRAMIEQDKAATLSWLGNCAAGWADRHAAAYGGTAPGQWWTRRARHSSEILATMAGGVR